MSFKIEPGIVYYLTTKLTFPMDNDEWTKQEAFTGSLEAFLTRSPHLPLQARRMLVNKGRCEWKDDRGTWIRLFVEKEKHSDWFFRDRLGFEVKQRYKTK